MGHSAVASMGAATFRSRKGGVAARRARGRACFNGAATFRSRKGRGPLTWQTKWQSFNGAATFRSRKSPAQAWQGGAVGRASMGPRPFGRGRLSKMLPVRLPAQLQWGRDLSVAEGCACTSL